MKDRVDSRWDLLVVMLMAGVFATATYRSAGWFYVAYMEEFKVDRQGASWPGSVYKTAFRCAGLFVTALRKHLSLFWIGIMGSCLLWGGIAASVFAPNIAWMSVTIGVVHGLGSGTVMVTHLVLVMKYFNKYRGVAAGVRLTGNPLSAVVFPAILSALKDAYGFRGALVVYTAITMHVTAFNIMLKEPPWLTSSKRKAAGSAPCEGAASEEIHDEAGCDNSFLPRTEGGDGLPGQVKRLSKDYGGECFLQGEAMPLRKCLSNDTENDPTTKSNTQRRSNCAEMRYSNASSFVEDEYAVQDGRPNFFRLDSLVLADEHLMFEGASDGVSGAGVCSATSSQGRSVENTAKGSLETNPNAFPRKRGTATATSEQCASRFGESKLLPRSLFLRLSQLCSKANIPSSGFVTGVLVSVLMDYVNIVHIFTMVDYALDKGVPKTHAAMTITYAAAPEILGRLLPPLAADVGLVSRPVLACGALTTLGILFSITPETSGWAHVAVRAMSSMAMASALTFKHVLVADYLGAEAISVVSGTSGLLLVPILFCNPLIMGYFRDHVGSYDGLFRLVAGIILSVALMLFAVIFRTRRRKPPKTRTTPAGA